LCRAATSASGRRAPATEHIWVQRCAIRVTNSFATDFVGSCPGLGPVLIAN
jgi:hypothetical protein